jgi:membrane-associated phospholipid phosphatase
LKQKFVQKKDDIEGNFMELLKKHGINEKKLVNKLSKDVRKIILELKLFYKRPRPFRLDSKLNDRLLKSMEGFAYPSGHSTQSHLLYYVLSELYPNLKTELLKVTEDIVFSRQMAKAHYPSDIKFGKKLAKSLFDYLKENKLIKLNQE